jgi:hypothetical protein
MAGGFEAPEVTGILASLVALAVAPAFAGRPVRHLANGPVAWAFGFIVLSLSFAVLDAARVPQPIAYAAVPLLATAAALVGRRRAGADETPLPRLWSALVAAFAVCIAIETVWLPVNDWDAVAIWYAKARALLLWHAPADLPMPTYPDLGPAAWALMLSLTGLGNEPIARLVFPAICVAWLASLPLLFEGRGREWRPSLVVGLFIIAVATFDFQTATSGYQDPLIAAVAGLAAILLGNALGIVKQEDEPPRGRIALAFFFAGSLGMIKTEGAVLGVIMIGSWSIAFAVTRGWRALRAAVPVTTVLLYVALVLLWPVLMVVGGIDVSHMQRYTFQDHSVRRFIGGVSRLPAIGRGFAQVSLTYSLVFLSAAVASVGALRSPWTRPILGWLWSIAALHSAWIAGVFILTNLDLEWHIRTALLRLVSQHAFVWVLALATSAVALFGELRRHG